MAKYYTIVFYRVIYEITQSFTIANGLSSTSFRIANDRCVRRCRILISERDKQPFPCIRGWSISPSTMRRSTVVILSHVSYYNELQQSTVTTAVVGRLWSLTIVVVWSGRENFIECCLILVWIVPDRTLAIVKDLVLPFSYQPEICARDRSHSFTGIVAITLGSLISTVIEQMVPYVLWRSFQFDVG